MWLFCLLDPFIPTQIKFLATPLFDADLCSEQRTQLFVPFTFQPIQQFNLRARSSPLIFTFGPVAFFHRSIPGLEVGKKKYRYDPSFPFPLSLPLPLEVGPLKSS